MTDRNQTGLLTGFGGLHRYRYGVIAMLTAVCLVLSSVVGSALAQNGYPAFQDPYVNDYGAVLAPENEVKVRDRLNQFRAETGIHAVLLTVNSISDYGTGDSTIESFATNLFNTWGIGDAARDDGILVLVAPGDRKVRIELGAGYDRRADQTAQSIIDQTMLPQFRDGLMAAGTIAGVDAVIDRFDPQALAQPQAIALTRDAIAGITRTSEGLIALMLAPLIPLGIGLKVGLGWWNRNRSRQCPTCHIEMRRLTEQEDDRYLEPGERREESLKSVDYDVWLCSSCGYHTTLSYGSLFSGYRTCSQCRHKTLSENTRTLVSPTYTSSGTAEVTQDCKHCGHHHTYTRTIPRKERSTSSSSSSGSGGGGSSSGGGASGSW